MLVKDDFKTHLYPELIEAIDRGDDDIIDDAIEAGEGEAMGYLSRYDIDTIFAETGTDRDKTLMLFLKDIIVWHFIVLANPDTDMALRKERYDDALDWLRGIQSGKITPKGWPLAAEETPGENNVWQVGSQPKRDTHY